MAEASAVADFRLACQRGCAVWRDGILQEAPVSSVLQAWLEYYADIPEPWTDMEHTLVSTAQALVSMRDIVAHGTWAELFAFITQAWDPQYLLDECKPEFAAILSAIAERRAIVQLRRACQLCGFQVQPDSFSILLAPEDLAMLEVIMPKVPAMPKLPLIQTQAAWVDALHHVLAAARDADWHTAQGGGDKLLALIREIEDAPELVDEDDSLLELRAASQAYQAAVRGDTQALSMLGLDATLCSSRYPSGVTRSLLHRAQALVDAVEGHVLFQELRDLLLAVPTSVLVVHTLAAGTVVLLSNAAISRLQAVAELAADVGVALQESGSHCTWGAVPALVQTADAYASLLGEVSRADLAVSGVVVQLSQEALRQAMRDISAGLQALQAATEETLDSHDDADADAIAAHAGKLLAQLEEVASTCFELSRFSSHGQRRGSVALVSLQAILQDVQPAGRAASLSALDDVPASHSSADDSGSSTSTCSSGGGSTAEPHRHGGSQGTGDALKQRTAGGSSAPASPAGSGPHFMGGQDMARSDSSGSEANSEAAAATFFAGVVDNDDDGYDDGATSWHSDAAGTALRRCSTGSSTHGKPAQGNARPCAWPQSPSGIAAALVSQGATASATPASIEAYPDVQELGDARGTAQPRQSTAQAVVAISSGPRAPEFPSAFAPSTSLSVIASVGDDSTPLDQGIVTELSSPVSGQPDSPCQSGAGEAVPCNTSADSGAGSVSSAQQGHSRAEPAAAPAAAAQAPGSSPPDQTQRHSSGDAFGSSCSAEEPPTLRPAAGADTLWPSRCTGSIGCSSGRSAGAGSTLESVMNLSECSGVHDAALSAAQPSSRTPLPRVGSACSRPDGADAAGAADSGEALQRSQAAPIAERHRVSETSLCAISTDGTDLIFSSESSSPPAGSAARAVSGEPIIALSAALLAHSRGSPVLGSSGGVLGTGAEVPVFGELRVLDETPRNVHRHLPAQLSRNSSSSSDAVLVPGGRDGIAPARSASSAPSPTHGALPVPAARPSSGTRLSAAAARAPDLMDHVNAGHAALQQTPPDQLAGGVASQTAAAGQGNAASPQHQEHVGVFEHGISMSSAGSMSGESIPVRLLSSDISPLLAADQPAMMAHPVVSSLRTFATPYDPAADRGSVAASRSDMASRTSSSRSGRASPCSSLRLPWPTSPRIAALSQGLDPANRQVSAATQVSDEDVTSRRMSEDMGSIRWDSASITSPRHARDQLVQQRTAVRRSRTHSADWVAEGARSSRANSMDGGVAGLPSSRRPAGLPRVPEQAQGRASSLEPSAASVAVEAALRAGQTPLLPVPAQQAAQPPLSAAALSASTADGSDLLSSALTEADVSALAVATEFGVGTMALAARACCLRPRWDFDGQLRAAHTALQLLLGGFNNEPLANMSAAAVQDVQLSVRAAGDQLRAAPCQDSAKLALLQVYSQALCAESTVLQGPSPRVVELPGVRDVPVQWLAGLLPADAVRALALEPSGGANAGIGLPSIDHLAVQARQHGAGHDRVLDITAHAGMLRGYLCLLAMMQGVESALRWRSPTHVRYALDNLAWHAQAALSGALPSPQSPAVQAGIQPDPGREFVSEVVHALAQVCGADLRAVHGLVTQAGPELLAQTTSAALHECTAEIAALELCATSDSSTVEHAWSALELCMALGAPEHGSTAGHTTAALAAHRATAASMLELRKAKLALPVDVDTAAHAAQVTAAALAGLGGVQPSGVALQARVQAALAELVPALPRDSCLLLPLAMQDCLVAMPRCVERVAVPGLTSHVAWRSVVQQHAPLPSRSSATQAWFLAQVLGACVLSNVAIGTLLASHALSMSMRTVPPAGSVAAPPTSPVARQLPATASLATAVLHCVDAVMRVASHAGLLPAMQDAVRGLAAADGCGHSGIAAADLAELAAQLVQQCAACDWLSLCSTVCAVWEQLQALPATAPIALCIQEFVAQATDALFFQLLASHAQRLPALDSADLSWDAVARVCSSAHRQARELCVTIVAAQGADAAGTGLNTLLTAAGCSSAVVTLFRWVVFLAELAAEPGSTPAAVAAMSALQVAIPAPPGEPHPVHGMLRHVASAPAVLCEVLPGLQAQLAAWVAAAWEATELALAAGMLLTVLHDPGSDLRALAVAIAQAMLGQRPAAGVLEAAALPLTCDARLPAGAQRPSGVPAVLPVYLSRAGEAPVPLLLLRFQASADVEHTQQDSPARSARHPLQAAAWLRSELQRGLEQAAVLTAHQAALQQAADAQDTEAGLAAMAAAKSVAPALPKPAVVAVQRLLVAFKCRAVAVAAVASQNAAAARWARSVCSGLPLPPELQSQIARLARTVDTRAPVLACLLQADSLWASRSAMPECVCAADAARFWALDSLLLPHLAQAVPRATQVCARVLAGACGVWAAQHTALTDEQIASAGQLPSSVEDGEDLPPLAKQACIAAVPLALSPMQFSTFALAALRQNTATAAATASISKAALREEQWRASAAPLVAPLTRVPTNLVNLAGRVFETVKAAAKSLAPMLAATQLPSQHPAAQHTAALIELCRQVPALRSEVLAQCIKQLPDGGSRAAAATDDGDDHGDGMAICWLLRVLVAARALPVQSYIPLAAAAYDSQHAQLVELAVNAAGQGDAPPESAACQAARAAELLSSTSPTQAGQWSPELQACWTGASTVSEAVDRVGQAAFRATRAWAQAHVSEELQAQMWSKL